MYGLSMVRQDTAREKFLAQNIPVQKTDIHRSPKEPSQAPPIGQKHHVLSLPGYGATENKVDQLSPNISPIPNGYFSGFRKPCLFPINCGLLLASVPESNTETGKLYYLGSEPRFPTFPSTFGLDM